MNSRLIGVTLLALLGSVFGCSEVADETSETSTDALVAVSLSCEAPKRGSVAGDAEGKWTLETVKSGFKMIGGGDAPGARASFAIDPKGGVNLAFYQGDVFCAATPFADLNKAGGVVHARRGGDGWSNTTVTCGGFGKWPELVVDAKDRLTLSLGKKNELQEYPKYVFRFDGSRWTNTGLAPVAASGYRAGAATFALDCAGHTLMADGGTVFIEGAAGFEKLAAPFDKADASRSQLRRSNGALHLAADVLMPPAPNGQQSYAPRYAFSTGGAWKVEDPTDGAMVGTMLGFELDGAGNPHVLYSVDGGLFHAVRTPAGWQRDLVDPSPSTTRRTGFTIDGKDELFVALEGGRLLRRAVGNGAWTKSSLIEHYSRVDYPSLAVDKDGTLHVAFYDLTDGPGFAAGAGLYYSRFAKP